MQARRRIRFGSARFADTSCSFVPLASVAGLCDFERQDDGRFPQFPSTPSALSPSLRERAASIDPDCVVALKALGEDTRVRIIGLLMDAPLDVGDITRLVGVSQYNVSKHLRILREAGLLQVEKSGRRHLYALAEGIRKRAAESSVLDLGCCSFRFEPPARQTPAARSNSRRKQSISTVARATR